MPEDPRPDPSTRRPPRQGPDPDAEEMQRVGTNPLTIGWIVVATVLIVLVIVLALRWL